MKAARSKRSSEKGETDPRPSEYAYTLYWARLVQDWTPDRRAEMAASVAKVVSNSAFLPNEFYRVYYVPGLDESAHAGASLVALQRILAVYFLSDSQGDSDD